MLILTDIDQVVLKWIDGAETFLRKKGFNILKPLKDVYYFEECVGVDTETSTKLSEEFNTSKEFANLDLMEGVEEAFSKLSRYHDLTVIGITAAGTSTRTQYLRWCNVEKHLPKLFRDIHFVTPEDSRKISYLTKYEPTIWIEDSLKGALEGIESNHTTYLINTAYNQVTDETLETSKIIRVKGWDEISESILNAGKTA